MRRRTRLSLIASALLLVSVLLAAEPGIPADKLKQAEATYAEVFGATHERLLKSGKPAEKAEFARKLAERSKDDTADAALREVLRRNALLFVQPDAAGTALALELNKAGLASATKKAAAHEKIAEWTEKSLAFEKPENRPKVAAEFVKGLRDAAGEYEKEGLPLAAVAATAKARAAARKYTPTAKDTFVALDADDRRLQPLAADAQELERLKAAVEKSPDDAKPRVSLGLAYLKHRRLPDAAEQFAATDAAEWAALAKALSAKPVVTEGVAESAAKAAAALPADDKKGRYVAYQFAEQRYEEAMLVDEGAAARIRPAYLSVLEKLVPLDPPSQPGKHALAYAQGLLDLADEQAAKKDATALVTLAKARAALKIAKTVDAKDLLAEIDAAEKAAKAITAMEADVAKYAEEARVGLLDAKSGLVYGLALLRLGKPADAAVGLGKVDGKVWPALAKLLADPIASPFAVGEALRVAAAELKGDEKTAVLTLARERYEAFLAAAPKDAPERTRVGLMVKELPAADAMRPVRKAADVFDLFADQAAVIRWFQESTIKSGDGVVEFKMIAPRLQVVTRGNFIGCAIPTDHQVTITHTPIKTSEHRFVGFWYRKDEGDNIDLTLQLAGSPDVTYGTIPSVVSTSAARFRTTEKGPRQWQFVVRDLFTDSGKGGKVEALIIGNRDTGTSFISSMIFGKTAAGVRSLGNRSRPR